MLNPIPKSGQILDYLNFGALFWYFPVVNVLELTQFSIGYMPVNIELTKFV